MNFKPHPGYENHVNMNLGKNEGNTAEETMAIMKALQKGIVEYTLPEGMTMEDQMIPGPKGEPDIKIRIFKPKGLPKTAPIILDIHGGGWVSGSVDIDNFRNIEVSKRTPAIVVAVDYRLSSEQVFFPEPLKDCITAFKWLSEHGKEIGGDSERLGLIGTSAGGNLAEGLALYIRDNGGPEIKLTVLNCAALTTKIYPSMLQMCMTMMNTSVFGKKSPSKVFLGNLNGENPSYYAMPDLCTDLRDLGPHYIVTAEYDALRDEGLNYALRLLEASVPTEIISAPRVAHGFCTQDQPLTAWVHDGICASFRREFGIM